MPSSSPELYADAWTQHMRFGRFADAWAVSDAVLKSRAGVSCYHWPRHEQYVWDGTPLAGRRVLVRCYHGLGDTIQFVRYMSLLKAVASEVIVWAQPALLPLLATVAGIDRLLPLHDGTPDVTYDVDVEIMELPYVFRTAADTLPHLVPYLHVDPATEPDAADSGILNVGLVWQSGDWDPRRTIPVAELAPLAGVPNVHWHILQQNAAGLGFGTPAGHDDLLDLARTVRSLDLVLTVDSMPAHLAGALGEVVWTMLPTEADWRWGEMREDSPWYPTMRLFRQHIPGDWAGVIRDVVCALRTLTAATPEPIGECS